MDACRVDLLDEVRHDYDFLADFDTIYSTNGTSKAWMETNFANQYRDEMAETAYVTGNPFSSECADETTFGHLDEVWRYAWDDELGTIPARPITDRAISTARELDPERMIVHYMQPHFPSVPVPDIGSAIDLDDVGGEWTDSIWHQLRAGSVSKSEVWQAYKANLEYVLKDVELLLKNISAETVMVSADHGNAMGEYGFYGHGRYPLRCVREVPWCTTSADDSGNYEPNTDFSSGDGDIIKRLQALGYRS